MDPNTSNSSLTPFTDDLLGCLVKAVLKKPSVNLVKDFKVSTGAIQMPPYSHRANKVLCQHSLFHFYKNVFLRTEILVIVFSGPSIGKEWHFSYKSARGAGFLLREILFIRGTAGHTGNFSHLFK